MPDWTCAKCGERIEGFSWDDKPWNGHVCNEIRKEIELGEQLDVFASKEIKKTIMDFL